MAATFRGIAKISIQSVLRRIESDEQKSWRGGLDLFKLLTIRVSRAFVPWINIFTLPSPSPFPSIHRSLRESRNNDIN